MAPPEGVAEPVGSPATDEAAHPAHLEVAVAVHAGSDGRHLASVLEAVESGLVAGFGRERVAVLVSEDGGQEGAELIRAWREGADVPGVRRVRARAPAADRGRELAELLVELDELGLRACGLVGADLIGLDRGWVELLLGAIVRGEADYVSPVYSRSASEGTLTTNLLAPLTRSLYGRRIHQLAGGCAGLSAAQLRRSLGAREAGRWSSGSAVEIDLVTDALASGAPLVEAHLGRRASDPQTSRPDLSTTIVRTVGPLFAQMERHQAVWRDARGSVPVPRLGGAPVVLAETGAGPAVDRMVRAFKLGLKDLLPVWEQIMPESTLFELYPLGVLPDEEFAFAPGLWARVVTDFAVAHHERRLPVDHLLRSLTPLYLGRVAAYHLEVRSWPPARVPDALERVARAFEVEKEHLVTRWR